MKNLIIAICLIFFCSSVVKAEDLTWKWTWGDVARQTAFIGASYINEDIVNRNIKKSIKI